MPEVEDSPSIGRHEKGEQKAGAGAGIPRRKSGVANKPIGVRQSIQQMLESGLTYREILQRLGPDADGLSQESLRRWQKTTHRPWQMRKARVKEFQGRREATLEAVKEQDFEEPANPQPTLENPPKPRATTGEPRPPGGDSATALDLAAAQVYEVLSAFDTRKLKQSLKDDAAAYTRLLNALARVAAETLKYERIRAEAARAAGDSRGICAETLGRIEEELKLF